MAGRGGVDKEVHFVRTVRATPLVKLADDVELFLDHMPDRRARHHARLGDTIFVEVPDEPRCGTRTCLAERFIIVRPQISAKLVSLADGIYLATTGGGQIADRRHRDQLEKHLAHGIFARLNLVLRQL